jgi:hypothetical protein
MKTIVLESGKAVKGGKVQLCFSQIVQTGRSNTSVLGILNASDDRFAQQKPRFCWVTAEPSDVQNTFGVDVSGLQEGEVLEIGMENPTINGNALNIQILETIEGTEYEVANFAKTAKRAGKDGDFIKTKDGMFIYQRTSLVMGEPVHTLIEETIRVKANDDASASIADALGA